MSDHDSPFDSVGVTAVRDAGLGRESAFAVAAVFSLLADRVRVSIVDALLVTEELCVGDVEQAIGVTPDAASYGLRVLRTAGLVEDRKEGRMRFYRLVDGVAGEALAAMVDAAQRVSRSRDAGGRSR